MKKALFFLYLLAVALPLAAQKKQQPADSLVRLMSAQSAEMIQKKNRSYRKVVGPARFLHNKTYLICDTAYWDVDLHTIQAFGHVRILQDETVLTSDKLDYFIDDDLAQFRGGVVQLQDKDRNTLRTRFLDYNTKDSVAIFKRGGAMRDKDGQLIESDNGSYDSKTKIFHFDGNVNMFTDSVFVKTEDLTYYSKESRAVFEYGVDIWKNANMLSARRGEYDREAEEFHFYEEVHGLTDKQEGWADTLHFNKLTQDIDLHGNVQVTDDSRKVTGLGENIWYVDSLDLLTMSVDATIIAEVEDENNKNKPRDTLYMAADRIVRHAIPRCDLSDGQVKDSEKRLSDLEVDPVSAYRKKAGEEAKKAAEEKEKALAESQGKKFPDKKDTPKPKEDKPKEDKPKADEGKTAGGGTESILAPADSTRPGTPKAPADSIRPDTPKAPADSTQAEAKDTTKISFVQAVGKVRVFKADMQARCDSLLYSDLDSLARLYLDPVVWNEGNRQYVSDSITLVVENNRMKKASLMSNAFITIQEDSISFDQIRGTEMMAYFDTSTVLQRFDALGGASAVFFLEENNALATVNKVESKMLSAYFDKGELQRIYYFDKPHNDAYPTVQLPKDDRRMKGFRWDPDQRPNGKRDITPYTPRRSERIAYETRPQAKFPQTEKYFPGYMKEVYAGLAARDAAQKESRRMRDSLELDKPKTVLPDSTAAQQPPLPDSTLAKPAAPDLEPGLQEGQAPDESPEEVLPPEESPEEVLSPEEGEGKAPDQREPAQEAQAEGAGKPAGDTETAKPAKGKPAVQEKPAPESGETAGQEDGAKVPGELQVSDAPDAAADSIRAVRAFQDSLRRVRIDSLRVIKASQDSIRALKAARDSAIRAKRAVRDSARQVQNAKREARWHAMDQRDAVRDSVKMAARRARYRSTIAKKLEIRDKEAEKDQGRLEEYIRKYEKKKAAREAREARRPKKTKVPTPQTEPSDSE